MAHELAAHVASRGANLKAGYLRRGLLSRWAPVLVARTAWLGILLWSPQAAARAGGIDSPLCSGCHSGGPSGTLSLVANPATFSPGQTVQFTLSLSGGYSVGGSYV